MNPPLGTDALIRDTLAVVLAGGQGIRLHPLTKHRAKPAVPFGGSYRIIDFTLSNCVNAGIRRILLLTQYKSFSLDRHLQQGWSFFRDEMSEFLIQIPPQQRMVRSWYEGTADAIFQNIYSLQEQRPAHTLILSGDHIYLMDYSRMVIAHADADADLTIGAMRVPREEARRFGVMQVDGDNRIVGFQEKPDDPETIPGCDDECLVSMGVYVFSTDVLVRRVVEDAKDASSAHDFGRNVIPSMVGRDRVFAYPMPGVHGSKAYWRDIGTLDSYWDASMELLCSPPPVNLFDPAWPVRTFRRQRPPSRICENDTDGPCRIESCLIAPGSCITSASISHSVIFDDTRIGPRVELTESIIMPETTIGEGTRLRRVIVDKNVAIPAGEDIGFDQEADRRRFLVTSEGIVVIPREFVFA
jgi:glucose-1-phosphate adenylyltransferase